MRLNTKEKLLKEKRIKNLKEAKKLILKAMKILEKTENNLLYFEFFHLPGEIDYYITGKRFFKGLKL